MVRRILQLYTAIGTILIVTFVGAAILIATGYRLQPDHHTLGQLLIYAGLAAIPLIPLFAAATFIARYRRARLARRNH